METLQIFILSLVQGITEFLPISSSAHLILMPHLLGFSDQGLAFDVAVHIGSLLAVITYFRRELKIMAEEFLHSLGAPERATENSRMIWLLLLGTLPIVVVGGLLKAAVETDLRSAAVIATTTIVFGLLLFWADIRGRKERSEFSLSWKDAFVIGLLQALAIIPGTSRSGITITAGLLLGLTREAASRFSFLLAIPTILLSGGLVTLDLLRSSHPVQWSELLLGASLSFIAAYLCIHFFLRLIEKSGMLPFVIYRLILGAVIFIFLIPSN
jgi:undecaprenyl-diphosphatase